jgi:hypothetical protein
MNKVCILLVAITYVHHNARFIKRKLCKYLILLNKIKHVQDHQWRIQELFGRVQQIQMRTENRENGDLGPVAPS